VPCMVQRRAPGQNGKILYTYSWCEFSWTASRDENEKLSGSARARGHLIRHYLAISVSVAASGSGTRVVALQCTDLGSREIFGEREREGSRKESERGRDSEKGSA
jgi:hypothetical protein